MSGHFILRNLTDSDFRTATVFPGITWSEDLSHEAGGENGNGVFPGWTRESAEELSQALQGQDIANRDNLPPHRYLMFRAHAGLGEKAQTYVTFASWTDNLIRPTGAGLGLKTLTKAAAALWDQDKKDEAFLAQCMAGTVHVEVYYRGGYRMV